MRFTGKVALITGGGSGIGAATARLMAREGAKVVVVDLVPDSAEAVAAETGGLALTADVADRAVVEAFVARAAEEHGRLDILVNNAGIGCFGRTPDLEPETWERVIAIDLNAVFYACRAAIPHMIGRKSAIVNTASISGLGGDYGFTAYNAAKAGVINYTRSLAVDHAREGIRVNCLSPGPFPQPWAPPGLAETLSKKLPMGRMGTPNELKGPLLLLASEAGSFITGQNLIVDGGWTAW